MSALLLGWMLSLAVAATQGDVDAVARCLDAQDVPCAQAIVQRTGMEKGNDPVPLAVAADVAFWSGDYPKAVDLIERARKAGFEDEGHQFELYQRTMFATAGWVEATRGRFRVRYRPGVDAVLVDDTASVLERTDRYVAPLIGGVPSTPTLVELFPDGRSFIAASSLTRDDVEATGVVAISKWTRLLVSSPRAISRGYEWQSTMSHEYIHLLVARATDDRAPVWLQEGIAKYLDARWERGRDDFSLEIRSQGYLAEALKNDALVPFDEMHPSLAKIKVFRSDGTIDRAKSSERAALAYAQLASLLDFCFETAGDKVLLTALPLVKQGMDPRAALASAARQPHFDALLAAWNAWIRQQPLLARRIAELPTVLDGGTEAEADPVMSQRKDLANYLRLGDLLAERGHATAALVEYAKAKDPADASSPLLATRLGAALLATGDTDRAVAVLTESTRDYPTYAPSWQVLGDVQRKRGDRAAAIQAYRRAVALAPFHVPSQTALAELYRASGDVAAAQRQDALLRTLRRGGEDTPPPTLHERGGEYELPRDPSVVEEQKKAAAGHGATLEGSPAPALVVKTLDGKSIALSSLRGKVVVLDFWATWCGPCRAVMPAVSAMAKRWGGQGLVVLGISDEDVATVQKFVAREKAAGHVFEHTLAVEDGSGRDAYGVSSIPQLVVIDQGGTVRLVHVGAGDMAGVQATVAKLLGVGADEVAP